MTERKKQAIEAPRGKTFHMDPEALKIAGPGHFLHDPTSPTKPSESLVQKIEAVGWFGVATVTKLEDEVFVLLGRERTLAMREVNRRRIERGEQPLTMEVQYRPCPEPAAAVRMMIAENKGRRQITQAVDAAYARLLATQGLIPAQIATELGCSEATVRNHLKLAEQPAFVLEAVQRGEISVGMARSLEGTQAEKRELIAEARAKGGAGAGKGKKKDQKAVEKVLHRYGLTPAAWKSLQAELRAL